MSIESIVSGYIDMIAPEKPASFKGVPGYDQVCFTWERSSEDDVTHYLMYREPKWTDEREPVNFENREESLAH